MGHIKRTFDNYFTSPTTDNAERALSALMERNNLEAADLGSTVIEIYNEHIRGHSMNSSRQGGNQ